MYKWQKAYIDEIKDCNGNTKDREKQMLADYEEKGFCEIEMWCLATATAKFALPRLKEFKIIVEMNPHNYSASLDDFDSMIYSFQKIIEGEHLYVNKEESDKIQKGLNLFSQHLTEMWY